MSIAYPGHSLVKPGISHPQPQPVMTAAYPCAPLLPRRIFIIATASLACLLINKAGIPGNIVFFLICGFMLTRRPATALAGAMLPMLGLCANTAFVPKTIPWTFGRFLNLFAFTGRFALAGGDSRWLTSPQYLALTTFCLVAAACSLLSGYYVHIALLKLFSFWVGMTGIFGFMGSIRRTGTDTTEWYIAQAAMIAMLCGLSLALGVGANFKGEFSMESGLYNLAFYHSQTMGPASALLILYLACVYLFAGHRNRWVCLLIAGALLVFLFMTRSRTGAGTLLAGLIVALMSAMFFHRKRRLRLRINVSRPTLISMVVVAALALVITDTLLDGQITKGVLSFAAKRISEVESLTVEEAFATRRRLFETSYQNFLDSPIYGIGFQVSTSRYFIEHATLFTAPVEKGFLPTAVLEEVGLVGATFFVVFLLSIFVHLIRDRNIPGLTMFAAFLACNLGEVTIFGLAGPGMYEWMLVAGGIVLGDRCTVPQLQQAAGVPRKQ